MPPKMLLLPPPDIEDEPFLEIPEALTYFVSNKGRVWSYRTGKFITPNYEKGGYCQLHARFNGKRKILKIHRLVLTLFSGEAKFAPADVNHIDGDKKNNVLENLEWCTRSENNRHAVSIGLTPSGENAKAAKLSQTDVIEIRRLYSLGGVTQKELATRFGVTFQNIHCVVKGKSWRHACPLS